MERIFITCSIFINVLFLYKYIFNIYKRLLIKNKYLIKSASIHLKNIPHDRKNLILNIPIVYKVAETEVNYLAAAQENFQAIFLPDDLIINPGLYQFDNKSYQLIQEGLYRFMFPEKKNQQRIIYTNNISILLSSISWPVTHGEGDDGLSYNDLVFQAKQRRLFLTCEAIARFAKTLLEKNNVNSRIIGTRTLDQWNSYDSGHYMLEVYRKDLKNSVLYELDYGIYFSYEDKFLSLLEFIDHAQDNYKINYLSNYIKVISPYLLRNKYNCTFINEGRLNNLKSWYQRIAQFFYIENIDENFSCHKLISKVIAKYPRGSFPKITYLPRIKLIEKFYHRKENACPLLQI